MGRDIAFGFIEEDNMVPLLNLIVIIPNILVFLSCHEK